MTDTSAIDDDVEISFNLSRGMAIQLALSEYSTSALTEFTADALVNERAEDFVMWGAPLWARSQLAVDDHIGCYTPPGTKVRHALTNDRGTFLTVDPDDPTVAIIRSFMGLLSEPIELWVNDE